MMWYLLSRGAISVIRWNFRLYIQKAKNSTEMITIALRLGWASMAMSLLFVYEILVETSRYIMSPYIQLTFFHMSHIYDKNKMSPC